MRLPAITTRAGAFTALGVSVALYGGNFVANRWALQDGLSPDDLVALRFLIAGPLLIPVFIALGWKTCAGLGWPRGIALAVTSGVPMVLLMNLGLSMAPAAYGAAVQPGMVTVVSTLGAIALFGVRPTAAGSVGIAAAIGGLACFALSGATDVGGTALIGVACFVVAGTLWGLFVIATRAWGTDPLAATAVVAVLSFVVWAPLYLGVIGVGFDALPWPKLLFHAVNQGILNTILALWLWTAATAVVGPGTAARFPPMIPVVGALLAWPLLGEAPAALQIAGVILIVGGLLLASVSGPRRG